MIGSQQWQSHSANWRRTVYEDAPEAVHIEHGIEAVPIISGLEQIPAEHHHHIQATQVVLGEEEKEILTEDEPYGPSGRHPLVCGMPRKWFSLLVVAFVVVIAIAVAVSVVVRAKQGRSDST